MANYAIFLTFENPKRGRLARDFTTNVPKILDLKSSSEQIFSENCRWVPLKIALRRTNIQTPFYTLCALENHCKV